MPATSARSPYPAIAALTVMTVLALSLWGAAFWQVGRSAALAVTATPAHGEVIACSTAPVGPGCTVRFEDDDGLTERGIDRPGLIGVVDGDAVPLWVSAGGEVTVAGWRPWADTALLTVLAIVVSMGATHWFARVLAAGDARTPMDLRTGTPLRRRRAG
ncbi:MAG: hypothetical protein Q4G43_04010 [Mobilicoccus sp.]|nr:hypothetical protein [Mobilicoccus sp.]